MCSSPVSVEEFFEGGSSPRSITSEVEPVHTIVDLDSSHQYVANKYEIDAHHEPITLERFVKDYDNAWSQLYNKSQELLDTTMEAVHTIPSLIEKTKATFGLETWENVRALRILFFF